MGCQTLVLGPSVEYQATLHNRSVSIALCVYLSLSVNKSILVLHSFFCDHTSTTTTTTQNIS